MHTAWASITVLVTVVVIVNGELFPENQTCPSDAYSGTGKVITVPLKFDAPSNEYYLDASFGTPGQEFSLVVDSTSFYTAFSSESIYSNVTRTFVPSKSSTIEPGLDPHGFRISGRIYMFVSDADQMSDILQIGQDFRMRHGAYISDNITLTNPSITIDGNLGLSPRTYDIADPLLLKMYTNNVIKKPMFTTFLKKTTEDKGDGGALTLGGIDVTNCDGIVNYVETLPVISFLWQAKFSRFVVAEETFECKNDCFAALDTTFQSIYGPKELIEPINERLGAADNEYKGVPNIDCSTISSLPDVELVFGDVKVTLTHKDYIIQRRDENGSLTCETVFFREKDRTTAPLFIGIPFLRKVCTVFEYGDNCESYKVGFMKPKVQSQ